MTRKVTITTSDDVTSAWIGRPSALWVRCPDCRAAPSVRCAGRYPRRCADPLLRSEDEPAPSMTVLNRIGLVHPARLTVLINALGMAEQRKGQPGAERQPTTRSTQ